MTKLGIWGTSIVVAALAMPALAPRVAASDPLEPFHAPAPDERRFVIAPQASPEDSRQLVEILVGRVLTVDCNVPSYLGKMERRRLLLRGLVYYVARDLQLPPVPTPPCPAGTPTRQAFVHLEGDPYLVRYDGKTPIVVYTPPDFEVRYRIWRADAETAVAVAE